MAIVHYAKGEFAHCDLVFIPGQLAFDKALRNSFCFRAGLKAFHTHARKTVLHCLGSQFPLLPVNFDFISHGFCRLVLIIVC